MSIEISGPSGFWSYTHADNEASLGKIKLLAERLQAEYLVQTTEKLDLFIDDEGLQWGEVWRERLQSTIRQTVFFIPIITPLYLKSTECRREFLQFVGEARRLGAEQLLLPIIYVHVALDESSDDEVLAIVSKTHSVIWNDLRHLGENTEAYSRGVSDMASRLAQVAAEYSAQPTHTSAELVKLRAGESLSDEAYEDDTPGISDRIAATESALPEWAEIIAEFPPITQDLNAETRAATARFGEGDHFSHKVIVARQLAAALEGPADRMVSTGERYASKLLELDPGVRAIIQMAGEQQSGENHSAAVRMFTNLRELISASRTNAIALNGLDEAMKGPARQFKDLRGPLKKINRGLQSVLDGQTVLEEWDRLMDESPLDESDLGEGSLSDR